MASPRRPSPRIHPVRRVMFLGAVLTTIANLVMLNFEGAVASAVMAALLWWWAHRR